MSDETIFDQIIARKIPANIIYEDEHVIAFDDINPQAPIHVLVIPKKKLSNFSEFNYSSEIDVGVYIKKISAVAKHLNLTESGYRVVFNTGENGQQTVNYIHAHILGGRKLTWPPG